MTYIQFIITLLIGYALGIASNITRKQIIDDIEGAKRSLKRTLNHKVGAVSTPTQKQIYLKEHPEQQEEIEEMNKVFSEAIK